MIDRKKLVQAHNPRLTAIDYTAPLTVGNGGFAYTVDVTGMQSLGADYAKHHNPLCTMSDWGWHVIPTEHGEDYTLADVVHTPYQHQGREIELPVNKIAGNEAVYAWLRENPHRFNLGQIGLVLDGQVLTPTDITEVEQTLDLYEGIIISQFNLRGQAVKVTTYCHADSDMLAFSIDTTLVGLGMQVAFPYGASNIAGADWDKQACHSSKGERVQDKVYTIHRTMDNIAYNIRIVSESPVTENAHSYHIPLQQGLSSITVYFEPTSVTPTARILQSLELFWERTGLIDFAGSTDPRARELERRIILSLYLSKVQGTGVLPPQETGLTCNSWHGKHHLEMHLWHSAYLPLFNNPELLLNSLAWYKEILPQAKHNASKNGYKGARWPKQVAYDGIDSPSVISPLLVWQQPHILYMLELVQASHSTPDPAFAQFYWEVVRATADFMCSYLTYNTDTNCYEITAPVIPAQEEFDPLTVLNPAFEIAYFKFGLAIAIKWAQALGQTDCATEWQNYHDKIAPLPMANGLYLSHANAPDTFERYNRDHPSMLMAYGLIPNPDVDTTAMQATLDKVVRITPDGKQHWGWHYETMWGWDFAVMAMTAKRLGNVSQALDLLLMDTPKNTYVASGNNYQNGPVDKPIRSDLPLYLPGNGSLLLAVALLFGEYSGKGQQTLNKDWQVNVENITPLP